MGKGDSRTCSAKERLVTQGLTQQRPHDSMTLNVFQRNVCQTVLYTWKILTNRPHHLPSTQGFPSQAKIGRKTHWQQTHILLQMAPKRKRSGGLRQRLAQARKEEGSGEMQGRSALAILLLDLFAWGFFSPQRVQEIAQKAVQDFERAQRDEGVMNDLRTLAAIGTHGAHASKCHSGLMKKAEHLSKLPEPFPFSAHFKGTQNLVRQTLLLPHELFSSLYHHYKHVWEKSVVPSLSAVRKFWGQVEGHPQLQEYPIPADQVERTIPIAIHGDGVPVVGVGKGWGRSVTNFSWYSLLGIGGTGEVMMWIWGMYDKLKIGDLENGTLADFFQVLRWSLSVLASGVWPHRDHRGQLQLDWFFRKG